MEVTAEQRKRLLTMNQTADHMFTWVYDVLQSKSVSIKQYNVLIKIMKMNPQEQMGYVIHENTLYPVPRKLKRYQKTATGWKFTKRYSGITKSRRKDK